MKRIISMLMALVMLFSVATVLVSCGAPEDDGAEISVYLGEEIYDFDPTDYYADSNAQQVMSLLFEPLFKINANGKLDLAAAKDYRVNKKERTIVIDLRESYWSDGIRVTADDFLFAWRDVILDPNKPNPASALFYDVENALEVKNGTKSLYDLGIKKTEIYQLTITYREGADYNQLLKNLASVATSPLRQDLVEAAPTYWSKQVNTMNSNGPFSIQSIDYDVGEFTLGRNVGYHQKLTVEDPRGQVTPASLVSFFTTEGELQLTYADIENKTVFFMGDATLADRAANKDKAKTADLLSAYTYVFNTEKELFANKNVRRALSLALDRAAIASAVTFGKAATGFIPYAVKDISTNKSFRTEDLLTAQDKATATSLINSAGITVPKAFTLTINNDPESLAIANLAKQAWTEIGFTVTINALDSIETQVSVDENGVPVIIADSALQATLNEASYGKADFDVIGIDWQMYSTDAFVALASLSSTMSGNGAEFATDGASSDILRPSISGWVCAEYDTLIKEAYEATDKKVRADKLHAAEALLIEESPVAPVLFNQSFYFASRDISRVSFDGMGNIVLTRVSQKNYQQYLKDDE